MRLKDLAVKYSSDKLYAHSYIEKFYEQEFANRKPKTLLEIGIGYKELMEPFVLRFVHQSSLKMWSDYFPGCRVVGIDVVPESIINYNVDKWETYRCDQSSPYDLMHLVGIIGRPDIIIDDGSHQTEHQIISAITLIPYVRRGGIYIIEDVQEPDYVLNSVWMGGGKIYKYEKRPDDCLIVYKF